MFHHQKSQLITEMDDILIAPVLPKKCMIDIRYFQVTIQIWLCRGSFPSNFEQVANLMYAQGNSVSYPQRNKK